MIEVWGRPIVAETKKKAKEFKHALTGKAVHIYQFEPPQENISIPRSQFQAARFSTTSKEKTFRAVGCSVISQTLPWKIFADEFRQLLVGAVFNPRTAGIIIQNPMPRKVKRLLDQIPYERDIDGLREDNLLNVKSMAGRDS